MLKEAQFVDQLSKLVSFPTLVESHDQTRQAFDYVDTLVDRRAHKQRLLQDGAEVALYSNMITKSPDILFLAHMDVVAGEQDQFTPRIEGDRLYGRGTSDMKFAIPLGIGLLNECIQNSLPLSYILALTSDEEVGGFEGAMYLANDYGMSPKNMLVLDGGHNFHLVESSKGIQVLKLESSGKTAHACRPYDGHNPIDPMVKAVNCIIEMFPDTYSKNGLKKTTLYVDSLNGGNSTSSYADKATCEMTICHPAELDGDAIVKDIEKTVHDLVGEQVEIRVDAVGHPLKINTEGQSFKLFKSKLEGVLGRETELIVESGGCDARHFINSHPEIIITCPDGGDIHGRNEYVSISASLMLYDALLQFVREYSRLNGGKL